MGKKNKIRTFVSIDIPEDLKIFLSKKIKDLDIVKKELSYNNCKLVRALNYHITLAFLGNTTKEELRILSNDFNKMKKFKKPIKCKITALGAFPNTGSARILFLNVESKRLGKLAGTVRKIIATHGFKLNHNFKSHITVARFKKKVPIVRLEEFNKEFEVNSFYLMQSVLTPNGPLYSKLDKFSIT